MPSRGPTSRDFVPRRFLDACQLSVPRPSLLPASKNLHNSGHRLPTGVRLFATQTDMTGSAYSITSSARARINGGIVRPSALKGAVDIASGAAKDLEDAGAVGDEQAPRRTRGRR